MDRFAELEEKIVPLLRPYVKRIAIYGSYARAKRPTIATSISSWISSLPTRGLPWA
ncbi:MAG: hypothetical protein WCY97_01825 [Methanothrix sp.]|jgi:hypothetical protein|uniref:DNA polymerase, beta domain protein region n=1 Tax=Methanothrix harundinacea TaxID=301375 RepID=A0A101IJV8_9EURY|nr:MAG: DNA polymerase, beta domain protein region [Methanothrix harundinacea]MDD2638352.1 hypothetical protein [Methanothrix sp.]MDI9399384.1 hypothetical protein [Euryarchaeota archaeon]KUK96557.1 MAG: DNA polymerase, beta domain protein region [Methanothrix harundinacea]MCP1391542.1 hypothetical protein [Methanothrix harundinacea]